MAAAETAKCSFAALFSLFSYQLASVLVQNQLLSRVAPLYALFWKGYNGIPSKQT